jgi:exonuclease III
MNFGKPRAANDDVAADVAREDGPLTMDCPSHGRGRAVTCRVRLALPQCHRKNTRPSSRRTRTGPRCGRGIRKTAARLIVLAMAGGAVAPGAQPRTFKLAFYNIRSGIGIQPLGRRPAPFAETANCNPKMGAVNAWGVGIVQKELVRSVNNDPLVLALGLAEAWVCASPARVREALGWKADSSERNGVAIVARYGFAGEVEWLQLDTSNNTNLRDTMWIVRASVCTDSSCRASIDLYAAHWAGTGPRGHETFDRQAQQSVEFMTRSAGPHALLGDLNVFEGSSDVCGQRPNNTSLTFLRRAGYVDAWLAIHGNAEGYTGMVNRRGCGVPEGYVWKRIDYAWSTRLTPMSISRFGIVTAGEAAPSDHVGIIAEYALPTGNQR